MRQDYLASLEEAFALNAEGLPTRGELAFYRLNSLERYCFAMR